MNDSNSSGGDLSGESSLGALWSAELRAKGFARFFGAAFLGVWLCGWLVGECFAATMLGGMVLKLVQPGVLEQIGARFDAPSGVGAVFIIGFLAFWLTFWTIGGIAAMGALLRQLGGVDVIELHPSALVIRRRAAIGRSTTRIPIEKVMDLMMAPRKALVAVAMGKQITVSDLGSIDEKRAVLEALRPQIRSLRSDPRPLGERMSDQLPENWRDASGDLAMTGDSSGFGTLIVSRNRGRVATLILLGLMAAIPAWLLGLALKSTVFIEPGAGVAAGDVIGPLVILVVLGVIGAAVMTWRREIRVRPGAIESRWSLFGRERVRFFEGARLEIEYGTDSDGDPWYTLKVWSGTDHATITSNSDYAQPLHLGHWLAQRLGSDLTLPREMREKNGHAA